MKLAIFFKDKKNYPIIAVIILAVFLIFFRVTRGDMTNDGAHYSLRAVGYLDYMMSQLQTTPLQWFENLPWWNYLSFHDHPPLIFLIQHIFFLIFGSNIFAARLPVALAGIGSVILIYLICQEIFNRKIGQLSALFLAVSTFFIWASRVNFLEGVEIFFILLPILFYFKALKNEKLFWLFGLFLGLSFLTKYTTFFLLPVFLAYTFFYKRQLFINKKFVLSLIIALFVFTPVIFYNLMVYKARGHFDVQFSMLFNSTFEVAKKDWPSLFHDQKPVLNYWQNFLGTWRGFDFTYSKFYYWLLMAGVIYVSIMAVRRKIIKKIESKNNSNLPDGRFFLFLVFIFLTILFIFATPATRYLPIFTPFLAMAAAVFVVDLFLYLSHFLPSFKKILMVFFLIILLPIIAKELVYNFNTNHSYSPTGKTNVNYSEIRVENAGFGEIEAYFEKIFSQEPGYSTKIRRISKRADVTASLADVKGKNIYIYENSLNWFATVWHFQRHLLYSKVFFVSDLDLYQNLGLDQNWFNFFYERGATGIYYIKGLSEAVGPINKDSDNVKLSREIERIFKDNVTQGKSNSAEDIKNHLGQTAFRVYYLNFSTVKPTP